MWLTTLEWGQVWRQKPAAIALKGIVLIFVGKPQLGPRGGAHGEDLEKYRSFWKRLWDESSQHQISQVGGAWRKRNCVNQGDYVPSSVYCQIHSQQKIQICLVIAVVVEAVLIRWKSWSYLHLFLQVICAEGLWFLIWSRNPYHTLYFSKQNEYEGYL